MPEEKLACTIYSADIPVVRIDGTAVTTLDNDRAPLCFRDNKGDLETWAAMRVIDSHRTNSRILKKILRMKSTSDMATFLRVHGATVTDNFWVMLDGEDLCWEKVRFKENYFDRVALVGDIKSYSQNFTPEQLNSPTPELTNPGSFEKCWRFIDGGWVLFKAGTVEERYSEVFVSRLGKMLGFDMAEYQDGEQYVLTPDFTHGKLNFEPAAVLAYENEDVSYNYDLAKRFSAEMAKQYLDILFMDALVLNVDRHTLNFGYLRDAHNGQVMKMAPNFDNNIALISRNYPDDPASASKFLVHEFHDLLKEKSVDYRYPSLSKEQIRKLAYDVMPDADIRRDVVTEFVFANYQALCH